MKSLDEKPLSRTEVRVIQLIAQGMMPLEVAQKLCRQPTTISTHLKRIKVKLRAKSTIHAAVIWAIKNNYGDAEYRSWYQPKEATR